MSPNVSVTTARMHGDVHWSSFLWALASDWCTDLSRSCSSRFVNSSLFFMNSPWFLFSSSSLYRACLCDCSTINSCSSIRRCVSLCFSTNLSSCGRRRHIENICHSWTALTLTMRAFSLTVIEKVVLPPPWASHRCPPANPRPCPGWRPSAGPAALSLAWRSHIWPPARPSRASLPSALWSLHLWPVAGEEDGSG